MDKEKVITVFINDQEISQDKVLDWEYKRLIATYKRLTKDKSIEFNKDFPNWIKDKEIDKMRKEVLRVKLDKGMPYFKKLLKKQTHLGNLMSKAAARISKGKRRFSITEFHVANSEKTPQEVVDKITEIMMVNFPQHTAINLNSNPDHYLLQSITDDVQEVIEFTGGSPLPTHFYAHYGNMEGLQSTLTEGYTHQLAGAARLDDGFIIGGMRHQVKPETDGFRFKALVEFPESVPQRMIEQHQYHLACEFGHWLEEV